MEAAKVISGSADCLSVTKGTVLRVCVGLTSFVCTVAFFPQMLVGVLVLAGRNLKCPLPRAVGSIATTDTQREMTATLKARSRFESKDPSGLESWQTPHGRFWMPAGSVKDIFQDLGEQERNIYGFNGRGARAGDIVLDGGANVGVYTRKVLDAGAKTVVAIEPAPENLACLRKTFAKEISEGRVIVYPKGVWDKDDVLKLNVDPHNSAGDSFVIQRQGSHTVEAPLTTIDKLVAELKLERVDYIKLDIEGAERRALAGAKNTLAKYHPRMAVCVYHLSDDVEAIPQAARKAWPGYRHECGPCLVNQAFIVPEVFFFF